MRLQAFWQQWQQLELEPLAWHLQRQWGQALVLVGLPLAVMGWQLVALVLELEWL